MPATAAVVVHHDSLGTLERTVADLVAAGVPVERLVVVDNTGADLSDAALTAVLPGSATVLRVANEGYAAAVNVGLDHLRDTSWPDAVLVVTHDVRLPAPTLAAMRSALGATSGAGVGAVGPTLYDAARPGRLWSAGGVLTPRLRLTRHALTPQPAVTDRDWLDGCCVLYRAAAVREQRLSEDYFLYFEEVDLHQRLRADGWRLVVVPETAEQSTAGTPTYYAMRNVRIFQRRWGRRGYRHVAWMAEAARQVATMPGRDRSRASVRALVAGWRAGRHDA